jgi:hypothetical protein
MPISRRKSNRRGFGAIGPRKRKMISSKGGRVVHGMFGSSRTGLGGRKVSRVASLTFGKRKKAARGVARGSARRALRGTIRSAARGRKSA